jgi:heterotetrameric sarcosine oxidase delta subunit
MILIECPYCGPRDETEYHYGGQAHVAYPADPHALSDREWAQYLFYRENRKGLFAERWSHSGGCRRWFNAVRDTVSYEIKAVYKAGEPQPDLAALAAPASPAPATAPATATAPEGAAK